jgi:hypothetical protein
MKLNTEESILHDNARVFRFIMGNRGYIVAVSLDWIEDGYLTRPIFHMSRSFFGFGIYRLVFFVSVMRFKIEVQE